MSLRLRNRWAYKGENWWEWEAFLDDGGTGELKDVKSVEYVLHPTFPEPIRNIATVDDGFLLRTSGWGEFTLKAFALMRDGSKKPLKHEVRLRHEPSQGQTE